MPRLNHFRHRYGPMPMHIGFCRPESYLKQLCKLTLQSNYPFCRERYRGFGPQRNPRFPIDDDLTNNYRFIAHHPCIAVILKRV
jgi:hypothetical protein